MKIKIESLEDLQELVGALDPAFLREWQPALGPSFRAADIARDVRTGQTGLQVEAESDGPNGLPADIAPPCTVGYTASDRTFEEVQKDAELAHAELVDPARDADGATYDTRWHSEPMKLTDKGVFRARRGRDNDAYKAWLAGQDVEAAEAAIAADDAEPVATETHALPANLEEMELVNDEMVPTETQEPGSEPSAAPAGAVDLDALIAASLEAAQDASDSHVELLNACRDFTSKHGHPAFTALKASVAPDDAGGGKAVQHFTPGERRLMQACIANYPTA